MLTVNLKIKMLIPPVAHNQGVASTGLQLSL